MSYMHIENLYKNQDILLFKECYALEKIHGTSAHISWREGGLHFFPGGENHDRFIDLFDHERLIASMANIEAAVIYGEAYGGKQQGMSETYGNSLSFICFEVKIGDNWLAVPQAESFATNRGLDFVHYDKVETGLSVLDALRDAPSVQAARNGIKESKPREGIVLRPIIEVIKNNGARIIAKHKALAFAETKTPREVDTAKAKILEDAEQIAFEWVTENRLANILSRFEEYGIEDTGTIIGLMIEDITREGEGEVIDTKEMRKVVSRNTALMFKKRLNREIQKGGNDGKENQNRNCKRNCKGKKKDHAL